MNERLKRFIDEKMPIIDQAMEGMLEEAGIPSSLKDSMAYSIQAGGKRIRPMLVLATLEDLQASSEDAVAVACAVEMIHTYSLIHDDLPSMDDDDFRRGKPTNHKVYGEAVAVLAGDALQTLAFKQLSTLKETDPQDALRIITLLADASGPSGMVGGQVLDIEGEHRSLSLEQLETVHLHKTGALLSFCIEAGAILAKANEEQIVKLKDYAKNIGLAFQIKDDILDITSTTEQLGKTAGSDAEREKSTYPALLGLDGAEERLRKHHQSALESIEFLADDQPLLGLFADYIVDRNA
ncbi:polyprenyl synthetase family protein [Sporosarcina cyprini]|uniref:polyprenyl synthetase family protein n=1 Tax=Sporosarcina cyprini TaxID=2910523 RepID=UPI001EDE5B17|nr:farnesyl diphosphate synthase [Sporosarcina cyprini]MCG3089031.1 polyprenyl synthetase family protein [Sporosarcina cyprini]